MNTDGHGLMHEELTQRILRTFFETYNELGYGYAESVYEKAIVIALAQTGIRAQRQAPISVHFRGEVVGEFAADVLVEDKVILELKSARSLDQAHEAQLLNYLRATTIEVGLLLNFGP